MNNPFWCSLSLSCILGAMASPGLGEWKAAVYQTAEGSTLRLTRLADAGLAPVAPLTEKQDYVFVDPGRTFQTFIGIGGALTDSAAETFSKLPEAKRRELLRAYYDPRDGIGYTLGRTPINSSDFSSESYTYVKEGDTALATFDIAPDRKYRIPLIREAIAAAGGHLTLFVSPWSPPAWMKDNGDMLHGGSLKPEYRDAWARYYVAFIRAYEKEGIPIWGLTVQNEPMAVQTWESCQYTAEQERDFVRDYLGPTLAKNGLGGLKLMVWDHNRTFLVQRADVILSDPAAAKYVWGIGFHWYTDPAYENVAKVHAAFPQAHLMLTEACNYPFDWAKIHDWNWGENYGTAILNDLNHGAEGWTDWNILLDETGGPNHVGNFCFAPVHADTRTGELVYMNSFYYLGHFSKFIRPGAKRILCSATRDALQTTAFANPDGAIAVVVLNTTGEPVPYHLCLGQNAAALNSPAHSITTCVLRAD